jgi:S-adenosylmethionine decarboxylase proenzyme
VNPAGTHIIVDLYHTDFSDEKAADVLRDVAKMAGCKVLRDVDHEFKGGGRTAVLLLSQSHVSVHTWPEHCYVAFDLYSCRRLTPENTKKIIKMVVAETKAKGYTAEVIDRGNSL